MMQNILTTLEYKTEDDGDTDWCRLVVPPLLRTSTLPGDTTPARCPGERRSCGSGTCVVQCGQVSVVNSGGGGVHLSICGLVVVS